MEGSSLHTTWVVTLDVATGRTLWKVRRAGHVYGVLSTASEKVALCSSGCWEPGCWVAAVDARGQASKDVFAPGYSLAAIGDELLHSWYDQGHAGELRQLDPLTGAMTTLAAGSFSQVVHRAPRLYAAESDPFGGARLVALDTLSRSGRWNRSLSAVPQELIPTRAGVLALVDKTVLHLDEGGNLDFSCTLPEPAVGRAVLSGGRLLLSGNAGLYAFPLKLEAGGEGWYAFRGGFARDGRAR